MTQVQN